MAIQFIEAVTSPSGTVGTFTDTAVQVLFKIYNDDAADLPADIFAYCLANIPLKYTAIHEQTLYRFNYEFKSLGRGYWDITCNYKLPTQAQQAAQQGVAISYSSSGRTVKVTQSLATLYSAVRAGSPVTDFQGLIGVTKDSVEGVDVVTPEFNITYETFLTDAVFGPVIPAIQACGKCINSDVFLGYQPGEVLLLGVDASRDKAGVWTVKSKFHIVFNEYVVLPGIVHLPILKRGHEYLWYRYRDDISGNTLVKKVQQANIESVYAMIPYAPLNPLLVYTAP